MDLSTLILGFCLLVSSQGQNSPGANSLTEIEEWSEGVINDTSQENAVMRAMFPPEHLLCSTGDLAPVTLHAEWRGGDHCYDLAGNKYQQGDILWSCCGCVKYTCTPEERDHCLFWSWTERVSYSCCVDCDGVVFPSGSVIRTTHLNDTCASIETERCEESKYQDISFVTQTVSPTTCCVNSSGLQPVKSKSVDPATCSFQTCVKTKRDLHASWLVQKEHPGCDCCIYNDTLVPDGWSTPVNHFQNVTCCKGDLQETYLPVLTECHIQNLTYLIDTSGSMSGSRPIWEPDALELLDQMMERQVDVVAYTLMNYVNTVDVIMTTSNNREFYDAVDNLIISGGSAEHTFAGLLAALHNSPCHNFICVFTDEVGDDTTNAYLKAQIIAQKLAKKSDIFFMVIAKSEHIENIMKNNFEEIGHVINLYSNTHAVRDVVELMQKSDICAGDCPSTPMIYTQAYFGTPAAPPPGTASSSSSTSFQETQKTLLSLPNV